MTRFFNKLRYPRTYRRIKRAKFVYDPTPEDLARWEDEDRRVNEILAARPVDPFGPLQRVSMGDLTG